MRETQMARIIQALREAEICSVSDLYANYLPNGRNEISLLIRRYGWVIEKTRHQHPGGTSHLHYRRIAEGPPKQLELVG